MDRNKAIGIVMSHYHTNGQELNEALEFLIPELGDIDGDRMKVAAIAFVKSNNQFDYYLGVSKEDVINWIDKQSQESIPEDINEAALQYVDTCKVDGRVRHNNINLTEPYWTNISMMEAYKAGWIACKCKQTQVTHIVRNIVKDSEKQVRTLLTENAKQDGGKQEPINKIEPKFKVGDWVTNGIDSTFKVMLVKDGMYYRDDDYFVDIETADKAFRLWDIKDAKDGDVLSNGEIIVIFKCFEDPSYGQHLISYIGLDYCGHIQVTDDPWYLGVNKISPATKEQHNLLFQEMKESGYEWDAENKELKKIENKLTDSYCKDNCKGYQETGKCFADGECKTKRDAMN